MTEYERNRVIGNLGVADVTINAVQMSVGKANPRLLAKELRHAEREIRQARKTLERRKA